MKSAPINGDGNDVAFLGPEGTFTHQAAENLSAGSGRLLPMNSIDDVYAAVETESVEFGVVPIENSVEGYVVPSLDVLLNSSNALAIGESNLDVSFQAYQRAGSTQPRVIVSHPHALAQCQHFVRELGLPTRIAASTATACRDLGDGEIAIGAPICQSLYGLTVLRDRVEDHSGAQTRFLLLAPRNAGLARARQLAFNEPVQTMLAITPTVTGPGVLARICSAFADRGINLTSLISRPLKVQQARYSFIFTLQSHPSAPAMKAALNESFRGGHWVKLLGAYPAPPIADVLDLVSSVPRGSILGDADTDLLEP